MGFVEKINGSCPNINPDCACAVYECPTFDQGKCPYPEDVVYDFMHYLYDWDEARAEISCHFNDVEEWVLRGKGYDDHRLLLRAFGYDRQTKRK